MSDAQEINYDYLGHVSARGWYANSSVTLVEVGIHLFMAIYGLSVFLETPKHFRKGRLPYIVVSFIITILTALSASLDGVWIFQHLFQATSGESFYDALLADDDSSWGRVLSLVAFTVVIFIGDALLVRQRSLSVITNLQI
ncbi:hypothetical protein EST38_g12252 [Candolleomyces aberdarensis]|uniref:Uncharacterized protein n=1 Tax=Candolleomyces aberdarensis TaxID=2316362 RepID=A0A4Q2D5H0_9AGAR|nr:hypothetical protein EST38_g12252 [Candolleomyces aberdarensis]